MIIDVPLKAVKQKKRKEKQRKEEAREWTVLLFSFRTYGVRSRYLGPEKNHCGVVDRLDPLQYKVLVSLLYGARLAATSDQYARGDMCVGVKRQPTMKN